MKRLSDKEALKIYNLVAPDDIVLENDQRRGDIIDAMRRVVAAKTNKEAAQVIEWWECAGWGVAGQSALADVRKIRKAAGK